MTADPVGRGKQWQLFYDEEGGLRDIFDALSMAYLQRMSDVNPWETEKLIKLSIANKVVREVESQVRAIIDGGKVVSDQRERTKRIEKLPGSVRKFI